MIKYEILSLKSGFLPVNLVVVGPIELVNFSVEQEGFISDLLLVYGTPN